MSGASHRIKGTFTRCLAYREQLVTLASFTAWHNSYEATGTKTKSSHGLYQKCSSSDHQMM